MAFERERTLGGVVGVGIIGFGNIARAHLQGYRLAPDVAVLAVADPREEARRLATEEFGIPRAVEDYAELLAMDDVQAVSICTPHEHHEGPFIAAARAGKHVHVEKPVSISLASANRMLAAARAAGVWTALGTPLRYYPCNIAIKEMLKGGRIGALELTKLNMGTNIYGRDGTGAGRVFKSWYVESAPFGGGMLAGQTVHYLDYLSWLVEEPVLAVTAQVWNPGNGIPAESAFDTNVLCILEFAGGSRALLETSWSSHYHPWALELYGSRGVIIGESRAGRQNALTVSIFGPAAGVDGAGPGASVVVGDPIPPGDPPAGHIQICRDFIDTIRAGKLSGELPTAEHGRDLQAIIEAGYLSSRMGRRVTIAEVEAAAS